MLRFSLAVCAIIAISLLACGSPPRPQPKPRQVGWRPITTFTGRGSLQTESFNIESTEWRIRWEAKGKTGDFQVMVHSAVSGRPLMEAIHQQGPGHGIAYVTEDPRLYHLVVESNDLDWWMAVDEAVVSEGATPAPAP